MTLFVAATKLTTAANAIFLQSVAPLYILLSSARWTLGERWTSRDLLHVGALALGLALCFFGAAGAQRVGTGSGDRKPPGSAVGRHLGRHAAVPPPPGTYSRDESGGLGAVIVGNAMASLVALPVAWPLPAAPLPARGPRVIYLGVFQIGLAYVFFTQAIRHVSALEASLLLLIEPVLNPIWTWLVHGGDAGPFHARWRRRHPRRDCDARGIRDRR